MKKIIFYLTVTFYLFLACDYNESNQIKGTKFINFDEITSGNNDSIIKNYKYIKLQTSDNCLIGEINKILYKNRFYILDKKITKTVFTFDKEGKFLFKISQSGKGPGEYIFINDFDVDEDGNIFILDIGGKKILSFNNRGNYISESKLDFLPHSFGYLGKNLFVLNQNDRKGNKYNIIYLKNGKIINKYFPNREFFDGYKSIQTVDYRIHHSSDCLIYSQKYDYSLYELTTEGIKEKYKLNFGKKNEIPLDELEKIPLEDQTKYLFENNYIWNIDKYFETKEILYFSFIYMQREWSVFFSKTSGKYKIFQCLSCLAKFSNLLGNLYPVGVADNMFISQLSFPQIYSLQNNPKSELFIKNKEFINSINNYSNPVLVIYQIKEF
jgi:hypothetical protein